MADDTELLPCPFCGAWPRIHESDWCKPHGFVVYCPECIQRQSYPTATTKAQAIARWNTRAPAAPKANPDAVASPTEATQPAKGPGLVLVACQCTGAELCPQGRLGRAMRCRVWLPAGMVKGQRGDGA